MGSKELDLATTIVLRDTRRGQICPIPVTGEGVGGLKAVDHTDCDGCYFADGNMDCPRIDENLVCSTGFKSLIYMPVQASEMDDSRVGFVHPMEPTFADIDRADEIATAAQALVDSSKDLAEARAIFEEAKARYDVAHTDWYKAWRAMTAFVDGKAETPVISIPTVQTIEPSKPMEVTITTTAPYVSTDDALDTITIDMTKKRPAYRRMRNSTISAEEITLATLNFDKPMTVAEVAKKTGRGESSIYNAATRLLGCGLISKIRSGKVRGYVINDATNPPVVEPNSLESKVIQIMQSAGDCSVTPDYVAPKMGRAVNSTKWIMIIMWRAGLLERDDEGFYSIAKGVE